MESTEFTSEALKEIQVRPVERSEEGRYREQMARHHRDLAPAVGGTTQPIGGGALKCGVRDRVRDHIG